MSWVFLTMRTLPNTWYMHAFNIPWIIIIFVLGLATTNFLIEVQLGRTALLIFVHICAVIKGGKIHKGAEKKFVYDIQQKKIGGALWKVLRYMVPSHVIRPILIEGKYSEEFAISSVLFVVIEDFDRYAHNLSPAELLDFLNRKFTDFDNICAKYGVTKIETVGEEYVAAVGVVPEEKTEDPSEHAGFLTNLACAASAMVANHNEEDLTLKLGIHTGRVLSGVIGYKLPRFRLFGDTINTAARMMQKGLSGEVQYGKETQQILPE